MVQEEDAMISLSPKLAPVLVGVLLAGLTASDARAGGRSADYSGA
jgi:hypothetical protein